MKIFTIGFTKKSAEKFIKMLKSSGVKRIVDIRLNNMSQLAGFAKRDDLCYFLKTISAIDYVHMPELVPTKEIIENYRKNKGDWSVYEKDFFELMTSRKIETEIKGRILDDDCLLCSEEKPDQCHRRLVAEYLTNQWVGIKIIHLM
jgi:uncharacterized protein (DUF488 family)